MWNTFFTKPKVNNFNMTFWVKQQKKKEKSLNKLNYWYMEILKWNASMPVNIFEIQT